MLTLIQITLEAFMDDYNEAARANRNHSTGERSHHISCTGAMRGIHDYRQMRNAANRRYRGKVERVTCVLRECAHTSLAKDDVIVAFRHDVFGCEQPFLERCSHPTLQQHGHL